MKGNRRSFISKSILGGLSLGVASNEVFPSVIDGTDVRPIAGDAKYKQEFFKSIQISYEGGKDETLDRYVAIFQRVFQEKSGLKSNASPGATLKIKLAVFPKSLPEQSYRISYVGQDEIHISSGDKNGILYGIGKLLHSSVINQHGLMPNGKNMVSSPDKPLRAIYFATHFFNFYHVAPIEKVKTYIEDLALWGYNHLVLWFDMHHYKGIDDPDAQKMLDRLAELYKAGMSVGMRPFCAVLANEGYDSTPNHLKSTPTGRSHYGVEICPSKKEGEKLILDNIRGEFEAFRKRGVEFDLLSLWPYDQGGCACEKCSPWGGNGFISISKSVTMELRKQFPDLKISLSTWLLDYGREQGEWKLLAEYFKKEKPKWINYLLADSHDTYPEYLLKNPVPGNLPLTNFPEISMWEQWPWGGFGASPLPDRFQELWNSVKVKVAGGWPYSEGIFEDINKVIYARFYWDENAQVKDIMEEYISFEYGQGFSGEILEVIKILEKNHGLSTYTWYTKPDYGKVDVPSTDAGSEKAYRMVREVDRRMPAHIKKSWRWRILFLRAMMDYELRISKGKVSPPVEAGFRELHNMYYVRGGEGSHRVSPPINNGAAYRNVSNKDRKVDGGLRAVD